MRFGMSEGMVMAAGPGGEEIYLLSPDSGAKPGQRIIGTTQEKPMTTLLMTPEIIAIDTRGTTDQSTDDGVQKWHNIPNLGLIGFLVGSASVQFELITRLRNGDTPWRLATLRKMESAFSPYSSRYAWKSH